MSFASEFSQQASSQPSQTQQPPQQQMQMPQQQQVQQQQPYQQQPAVVTQMPMQMQPQQPMTVSMPQQQQPQHLQQPAGSHSQPMSPVNMYPQQQQQQQQMQQQQQPSPYMPQGAAAAGYMNPHLAYGSSPTVYQPQPQQQQPPQQQPPQQQQPQHTGMPGYTPAGTNSQPYSYGVMNVRSSVCSPYSLVLILLYRCICLYVCLSVWRRRAWHRSRMVFLLNLWVMFRASLLRTYFAVYRKQIGA